MPGITSIIDSVVSPPLDFLTFTELTPGHSVTGLQTFTGVSGYGLRINFDPIPVQWGYSIGAINVYEPPLASVAFLYSDGIYAVYNVQWGDWLLYPTPPGPLTTFSSTLAVRFQPGIFGRVYAGAF
jgi:hypothetical protein